MQQQQDKDKRSEVLTTSDPKAEQRAKKKKVDVREPLLLVACGKKGVGKTYTTLGMIEKAIKGNPKKAIKPQKVLIFDVNDEFGQYKRLSLSKIKMWCDNAEPEARRISIKKAVDDADLTVNGKKIFLNPKGKMTLKEMAGALHYILDHFRNGILLIEDINRYVSDSLPSDLIGAICTQRHVGVDIVLHFQNIGRFGHPKILGNANYLRLHKTTDMVARHEKKFEEYIEPLEIAEIIVNNKYQNATSKAEESFYIFFDVGKVKIKGGFDKEDWDNAVTEYLERRYNTLISPKLKEINIHTGKPKYIDHIEVVQYEIQRINKAYYGND